MREIETAAKRSGDSKTANKPQPETQSSSRLHLMLIKRKRGGTGGVTRVNLRVLFSTRLPSEYHRLCITRFVQVFVCLCVMVLMRADAPSVYNPHA